MTNQIETLRQSIAALNVTSPVGAEKAAELRGDYRGQAVTLSTDASKLSEAAEEIGMSVAHRVDKRSLDRRDVRQGQGASLEALARIADYYDQLPDMPDEEKLRALVAFLQDFQFKIDDSHADRGGGENVTKEDILAALQKFDPDVTHQYAALDISREFFSAAGAGNEFQFLLDQVHAEYQSGELAREVRAGFASSQVASIATETLETDPATVRESYRSLLRESKNMGQLFEAFRQFDVMKQFEEVIDTFMLVAGRDLASTSPSTDTAYLHALVSELSKLKKMKSVIDMASQLTRTTDRLLIYGENPVGGAADVATRVLSFAASPSAASKDARAMLERYEGCSVATQLNFANGLRKLHAELPDEVIPSTQARLQQNTAIVKLLDELVIEEEQEYELHSAASSGSAAATVH